MCKACEKCGCFHTSITNCPINQEQLALCHVIQMSLDKVAQRVEKLETRDPRFRFSEGDIYLKEGDTVHIKGKDGCYYAYSKQELEDLHDWSLRLGDKIREALEDHLRATRKVIDNVIKETWR